MRRVLHEQGADYIGRFDELKFALAPYVATNAGEQRRFYRLWDDYLLSLEQQLVEKEEVAPPAGWRKWAKQLRYLLIGTVSLSLILLLWSILRTKGPVQPAPFVAVEIFQEAEARAGQPLQIRNGTLLETGMDTVDFVWDIRDLETGISLFREDSFDLHYIVPDTLTGRSIKVVLWAQQLVSEKQLDVDTLTLAVLCSDPPQIPSLSGLNQRMVRGETWLLPKPENYAPQNRSGAKAIAEESEIIYRWLINGEMLEETPEEYVFSKEGQTKVQLLVQRAEDPENCFALSPPRNVQVGSNVPVIPTIALKRDVPRQILKTSTWLYLIPFLFGLLVYLLHRRKWKKKEEDTREKTDEELALAYPFHDVGPYVIPYQDQSGQISVPADFFRIADQLRVREAGLRMSFDGKATVEATVREGGFPSWREKAVKRRANYLVLLRHTDEFQQQDRLLKRLTDFLMAREAELDVYYHAGDFSWFWNDAHPKGWSPSQMTGRYGEHRLIVLGDGHGLVDAFHRKEPRLEPTKERWLMKWARRLLLTTEPAVDWSFQEVLLHKSLLLYPATTNGILRGVADLNQVEEYQGTSYSRWKAERFRRNPEPSHRYRTWTTVGEHRDYLANDPELFRWLTALSVAPNPDWSLTIAIGRGLGLNVTHDRLLQLSRIPWLADNAPDQDLRLALLAELSTADEQLARTAVLEQLEAVSGEVDNTFAESEWTANQAVQTFALAPMEAGNQTTIRDLRRLGILTPDQLAELNQVAERQLPATKAGQKLPGSKASLDELLHPTEKAGKILNEREKELLGLIVVCLLMLLPMYLFNKAGHELNPGGTKAAWQELENPTDDAHWALEKNNAAVAQANLLDRVDGYMRNGENKALLEGKIKDSLQSALSLMDGRYPLVDTNLAAFQLNRLAYSLNWVAADSALLGPMLNQDINDLLYEADLAITDKFPADSRFALLKLHAEGLFSWQSFRSIETTAEDRSGGLDYWIYASQIKAEIDSINPEFFNSLRDSMPVNLEYLLSKDPRPTFAIPPGVVSGRVVNQDGQPLERVVVKLGGNSRKTSTNEEGRFALEISRSKGYLEVAWQDVPPIEVSLFSPGSDYVTLKDFYEITLNVPEGTELIQRPSKEIRGRVKGPDGKGLPGVNVTASRQNSTTKTDQNGYYFLTLNDDPATVSLVFEIDGLRRERNYQLAVGTKVDLGEILLTEPRAMSQEPEVSDNILRGRVVDESGAPLTGVSLVFQGTANETRTNAYGLFEHTPDLGPRSNKLAVYYEGYIKQTLDVNFANDKFSPSNLGTIVLKKEAVEQQQTEEERLIERLLGGSTSTKFNRGITAQWSPAATNSCINSITSILKNKAETRGVLTGDELIASLQEEYGDKVAVGDGPGNTSGGQFLFFGPSLRIPRLRDRINTLTRNSEALIISTSRFEDQMFSNYPDLAGSSVNLNNELKRLGFNVTTLLDPTKAEMLAALAKVEKANTARGTSGQFLLMFNTYKIGGDIIATDSKYGVPATYLSESELSGYQKNISGYQNRRGDVVHTLVIGNFMNFVPKISNPGPQQIPGKDIPEPKYRLVSSGVSGGEIGLGIGSRSAINVTSSAPGIVYLDVCIDAKGRVVSADSNPKRNAAFDPALISRLQSNVRKWEFKVLPLVQPSRQCGQVSFQFK